MTHELYVMQLLSRGQLDRALLFVAGVHTDFADAVRGIVEQWLAEITIERDHVDRVLEDGHCPGCRLKTCQGGLGDKV